MMQFLKSEKLFLTIYQHTKRLISFLSHSFVKLIAFQLNKT